jgi:hypothetical protein
LRAFAIKDQMDRGGGDFELQLAQSVADKGTFRTNWFLHSPESYLDQWFNKLQIDQIVLSFVFLG